MVIRPAIATALLNLVVVSMPSLGQEVVPRYKLEVGQEIQYQERILYWLISDPKDAPAHPRVETSRVLWVVSRNADGSRRIVERETSTEYNKPLDGQSTTTQSEDVTSFDVFPDGKVVSHDSMRWGNSSAAFPPLPRDIADKTWRSDSADGEPEYTSIPAQTTSKDFVFQYQDNSLEDQMSLATDSGTTHFDLARGLVASVANESTQDYGFHVRRNDSYALKSAETKDQAFITQLAGESEAYFKAVDDYVQAQKNADKNGEQTDAIMKHAGEELREVRSKSTLPMFATAIDKILAKHERVAGYIKGKAKRIADTVNKPAADWTLKDLAGKSHSLADYRGKVVLLDFWYRGCGWCIKAMPQMKQVVDDFKNDPVVVLGMNIDEDEKDAQFVADRMHLNYNTLRAAGIPQKYGVLASPAAVIIDPQGTVRAVHVGYSPDLRQELDKEVRKCLPGNAARQPS